MIFNHARHIRHPVFWPPFIVLTFGVISCLVVPEKFMTTMKGINSWIISNFGGMFCWVSLMMLLTTVFVFFTPLGKVKIGGSDAKPLLSPWKWFSITLCTTIAAGILFWGTAEPLFHLMQPPEFSGAEPGSLKAAYFAIETLYLHWAFTPYGIYAVPALVFTIVHYNHGGSFSLVALVQPLLSKKVIDSKLFHIIGGLVDTVCLYALVAGMAAALGGGILTLAGGADRIFGLPVNNWSLLLMASAVVVTFTISSVSGLMKGIRILSDINAKIFFLIVAFVFFAGPTGDMISYFTNSIGSYFLEILPRTVAHGAEGSDIAWMNSWTVFYWAVWMTWAPVTALFLGRLGLGYTVRVFLLVNFILPSFFAIAWMSIFGGASVSMQMAGFDLHAIMKENGIEQVVYSIFTKLPGEMVLTIAFFSATFLSFVTAADSNSAAMASISIDDESEESGKVSVLVKVAWGALIGSVAYIMVSMSNIEGIKMSSNLGGLPAMFLLLSVTVALWKLIYDSYKGDIPDPATKKEDSA